MSINRTESNNLSWQQQTILEKVVYEHTPKKTLHMRISNFINDVTIFFMRIANKTNVDNLKTEMIGKFTLLTETYKMTTAEAIAMIQTGQVINELVTKMFASTTETNLDKTTVKSTEEQSKKNMTSDLDEQFDKMNDFDMSMKNKAFPGQNYEYGFTPAEGEIYSEQRYVLGSDPSLSTPTDPRVDSEKYKKFKAEKERLSNLQLATIPEKPDTKPAGESSSSALDDQFDQMHDLNDDSEGKVNSIMTDELTEQRAAELARQEVRQRLSSTEGETFLFVNLSNQNPTSHLDDQFVLAHNFSKLQDLGKLTTGEKDLSDEDKTAILKILLQLPSSVHLGAIDELTVSDKYKKTLALEILGTQKHYLAQANVQVNLPIIEDRPDLERSSLEALKSILFPHNPSVTDEEVMKKLKAKIFDNDFYEYDSASSPDEALKEVEATFDKINYFRAQNKNKGGIFTRIKNKISSLYGDDGLTNG